MASQPDLRPGRYKVEFKGQLKLARGQGDLVNIFLIDGKLWWSYYGTSRCQPIDSWPDYWINIAKLDVNPHIC